MWDELWVEGLPELPVGGLSFVQVGRAQLAQGSQAGGQRPVAGLSAVSGALQLGLWPAWFRSKSFPEPWVLKHNLSLERGLPDLVLTAGGGAKGRRAWRREGAGLG